MFCVLIVGFPTASIAHCCRGPLIRSQPQAHVMRRKMEEAAINYVAYVLSFSCLGCGFSFLFGGTMPMCFNFRRAFPFPTLPNLTISFVGGELKLK